MRKELNRAYGNSCLSLVDVFLDLMDCNMGDKKNRLFPMSRITPKRGDTEMDTVAFSEKHFGDRRAFDVLMGAQH